MGVRVFSMDFSGSGISEGEYVTLGAHEVEDLEVLVEFIRGGGHTSVIALWGRSMGAVTSLLYSERDPSVAALILDSPFSRLTDLMRELAEEQKIPLWGMLGGTALRLMRRSVKKRAGFDINGICPLDAAPRAHVPAFFGHAAGDTFVRPHHSERLFEAYSGDKEHMVFENCDHNSPRPMEYYNSAAGFLSRALRVPFEAAMLQSVMSEASMLLPGIEMGQTHPISPFGPTRALSDFDADGADVDFELQQALALSLESCSVASSSPCGRAGDAAVAAAAAVVAAAGPPGAAGRTRGGEGAACQNSSEAFPAKAAARASTDGSEASALDDGKERMSKRVDGGVKTLLRQISPLGGDRHGRGGAAAAVHPPEPRVHTTKFSGRPGDLHLETPFAARAAEGSPAALKDPPSSRGSRSGAGSCSSRAGTSRPGHTAGLSLGDCDAVATRSATETFMPDDLEAGDSVLGDAHAAGDGAAAADVHV